MANPLEKKMAIQNSILLGQSKPLPATGDQDLTEWQSLSHTIQGQSLLGDLPKYML